jgi:glycosyltransferase involved in cell wall biosynthesis
VAKISIITTAINRPAILQRTIESLLENADLHTFDCEWIVHVDLIKKLPLAQQAFDETIALCRSYNNRFKVTVIPNLEAQGPSAAIIRIKHKITSSIVFYLEDDWVCGPEVFSKNRFSTAYFLDRLETYAYATCAARLERCSFNPCFMRFLNFNLATLNLDVNVDAERQANRIWTANAKRSPPDWRFDPTSLKYFTDIGREWIKNTPLIKWNMDKRYATPTTYNVEK